MKEMNIHSVIKFCQLEELAEEDRRLVSKAIEATERSYAHYSHFNVGACLRLADGTEFLGANQENAVFPVGLCAERTAIFAAQVQRPDQPIVAIAIAAKNEVGLVADPVSPCGSCRQVMLEVEERYHQPMRILLYGTRGVYVIEGVKTLLPLSFVEDSMK
jgi:cytidine deaminase